MRRIYGAVFLALVAVAAALPGQDPPTEAAVPLPAPMPRYKATGDFLADWNNLMPVGQKVDPKAEAQPEAAPGPRKADDKAFQLGRAKPKMAYDIGKYRAVVGSDGKTRYFPRMTKYIDAALKKVPLPDSVNLGLKAKDVIKRMYLNNQYGCCVISSRYHRIGIHVANDTGVQLMGTDAEVYSTYQAACGRGDNGCDMSAVNRYEQTVGLKVNGVIHKIDGAVSVDHTNKELVKTAIVVFGTLNIGFSLPNTWYSSADGSDWDLTNSGIVGGHEVQAFGYDEKGVWISTWGGVRRWLWPAFLSTRWTDEMYTSLSPDWYGQDNVAPNGIVAADLKADLAVIAGGGVPPLPEPPVPVPPVPVPGKLTLIATPAAGNAPLTVTFTSTGNAAGGSLTFGDGSTPTLLPATHTYAATGTYTATLKTATETATAVVSVGTGPAPQPGTLGAVTADPTTGVITFTGPWRIKGGVIPSLADELAEMGIGEDGVKAVLSVIEAMKTAARRSPKEPGPGSYLVPRRRFDREPLLAV